MSLWKNHLKLFYSEATENGKANVDEKFLELSITDGYYFLS
jgi:hypothetical protein